jgi:hypothetical protein
VIIELPPPKTSKQATPNCAANLLLLHVHRQPVHSGLLLLLLLLLLLHTSIVAVLQVITHLHHARLLEGSTMSPVSSSSGNE